MDLLAVSVRELRFRGTVGMRAEHILLRMALAEALMALLRGAVAELRKQRSGRILQ